VTLLAHAKWFVEPDGTYPADQGFLAEPLTLGLVVSAAGMTVLWVLATRRWPAAPLALGHLVDRVPRLLATTLGVSLAALAAERKLLSPGVALGGSPPEAALATFELLVAAWLIVGAGLRGAAFALAGLIAVAALAIGPVPVLESGVVVGIALYLALAREAGARGHREGARALRVTLGASLVVVAFTEKLTGPAVTQAVIHEHPSLNVLAAAGLPFGDLRFVAFAGAAEVFLGLVIMSGAGAQMIALAALFPFAATVAVFGVPELVGHLPIYGALCALAITGSTAATGAQPPPYRAADGPATDLTHRDAKLPARSRPRSR